MYSIIKRDPTQKTQTLQYLQKDMIINQAVTFILLAIKHWFVCQWSICFADIHYSDFHKPSKERGETKIPLPA